MLCIRIRLLDPDPHTEHANKNPDMRLNGIQHFWHITLKFGQLLKGSNIRMDLLPYIFKEIMYPTCVRIVVANICFS
jgi:hypothetical protein